MSIILDMAKQKECKPRRYTEMHRLPREMKSEQDWLFAWRLSPHGNYSVLCHKILGVNNSREKEFSCSPSQGCYSNTVGGLGTEKHLQYDGQEIRRSTRRPGTTGLQ